MDAKTPVSWQSLCKHVEDPRARRHRLEDMLLIAVCACLGGADDGAGIAACGQGHREWFARWLAWPHGIPARYLQPGVAVAGPPAAGTPVAGVAAEPEAAVRTGRVGPRRQDPGPGGRGKQVPRNYGHPAPARAAGPAGLYRDPRPGTHGEGRAPRKRLPKPCGGRRPTMYWRSRGTRGTCRTQYRTPLPWPMPRRPRTPTRRTGTCTQP